MIKKMKRKKKTKKMIKKSIALLVSFSICFSLLTGCEKKEKSVEKGEITTEQLTEIITEEIASYSDAIHTDTDSIVEDGKKVISDNWEDYVGDIDTFVYGLIINEYNIVYDTFNAMIELPDGSEIYGIGYTDYETYFESDDKVGYFSAGFISLIGEESIPSVYADEGLEILNLDYDDEDCRFIYSYGCNDYTEHCVIWNQYLKYGVKDGVITYECNDYEKEACDESIGALYSYDENKYLYDPEVGEYVYITGTPISESIDYDELQKKVNEILDNQDQYFSSVEVETSAHIAHEALESYLLSKQNEEFMGYDVEKLIEISKDLDPMKCIQISSDGLVYIDASQPLPEDSPSKFMKWMTGICCGLVVAGSVAVNIFIPGLTPVCSALMSAAIESFTEVVFQNHSIKDINWAKVGVAAVTGAIISCICPALASKATSGAVNLFGKTLSESTTKFIAEMVGHGVLTISNSLVSGATYSAFAYLDGESDEEIYDAFKTGAVIGGALTIITSVVSSIGSSAMKAINRKFPNNWVKKMGDKFSAKIVGKQKPIQIKNSKLEDFLVPKSIHQSAECAWEELYANQRPLYMQRIERLAADDNAKGVRLIDDNYNTLKKSDLYSKKGNCKVDLSDCKDENVINAILEKGGGDYNYIDVNNGKPNWGKHAEGCFIPEDGITSNRTRNMNNYYKDLANHNEKIPKDILKQMKQANIKTTSKSEVETFIKTKWTLEESENGYVYIINKYIHGAVPHFGGVGRANALEKIVVVEKNFGMISSSSPEVITGTLLDTE